MSSPGHFHALKGGGRVGARVEEGVEEGGGLHGNSQVPSCHVWTEIGAVSIGTT